MAESSESETRHRLRKLAEAALPVSAQSVTVSAQRGYEFALAATPQVVLALLDEVDHLQVDAKRIRDLWPATKAAADAQGEAVMKLLRTSKERDALAAEVARLRVKLEGTEDAYREQGATLANREEDEADLEAEMTRLKARVHAHEGHANVAHSLCSCGDCS